MTTRISLLRSERTWWHRARWSEDVTVRDDIPKQFHFTSGRATLLTPDGDVLEAAAVGGAKMSVSDFSDAVTFERVTLLPSPIPISEVASAVRARSKDAALRVFDAGVGLLSEIATADIRAWLTHAYPDASTVIEALLRDEPGWMTINVASAEVYRMERDAINLALEVAGFDREAALIDQAVPDAPEHFELLPIDVAGAPAAGLDEANGETLPTDLVDDDGLMATVEVGEDSIVIDDTDIFPGWERIRSLRPTGRVFEDASTGRQLTILHANKNSIEHTTGVDLVYFVHDFSAFVLVQYKRARREGTAVVVRINSQLDSELDRMTKLEETVSYPPGPHVVEASAGRLDAIRLSPAMCYFKLCDVEQSVEITDMSRGKIVDLPTWRAMRDVGMMKGPQGGRVLNYDKVDRYLTNSLFAELVGGGWLGSRPEHFNDLLDYINERYQAGRSLILGALQLGATNRRRRSNGVWIRRRPVASP